jgi:hypothetical protein
MLKTVSSITNAIGALNYKGTWNASTNTPTITSSVGVKGDYYQVSVAGSTAINGISNWGVGDVIAFNGTTWQRIEGGADLNGVNLSVSGTTTLSGLTASTALALNAGKDVVSVTNTGTGNNVLADGPTLTTPNLGVATATSVNKVAITAPATGSTLTIADGKTLTANNSIALTGTDATTMTFPTTSATIARTDAAQAFTGDQTIPSELAAAGVQAYRYISTVTFTSSGNFTKATYPWLRAIRVKVVGSGGGGAGAAAVTTSEGSCGSGAGSGAYAESFITNIAGLSASETVTIGAGGAGVSGAAGNDGSSSSFGTLVVATGGVRGTTVIGAGSSAVVAASGSGGAKSGCTGDFTAGGTGGVHGVRLSASNLFGGSGAASIFGGGQRTTGTNSDGVNGDAPGAGGSGAAHIFVGTNLAAKAGGNGADGIVIVELFA